MEVSEMDEKVILFTPGARLACAVRAARRRRGWSLLELALRVHCDPRTINRIELGETKTVSLHFIAQLSRELRSPLVLRLAVQEIQASFPPLADPAAQREVA